MMTLPSTTEMYRALVERDRTFEGLFFACVRTIGRAFPSSLTCRMAARSARWTKSMSTSRPV
jgi:methylphosphotriester-DNA--protein-cysteine methyltransferase